jgi:hypothetical protein
VPRLLGGIIQRRVPEPACRKPLDYEVLERWTRVGFERGMSSARESVDRCGESACSRETERPHAIAWGLCPVAQPAARNLERSPRS